MIEVKITTVGNSAGIILPKEVLAKLDVKKGDKLFLTERPDGYSMHVEDEEFKRQMGFAEEGMREYRNALKELSE